MKYWHVGDFLLSYFLTKIGIMLTADTFYKICNLMSEMLQQVQNLVKVLIIIYVLKNIKPELEKCLQNDNSKSFNKNISNRS